MVMFLSITVLLYFLLNSFGGYLSLSLSLSLSLNI